MQFGKCTYVGQVYPSKKKKLSSLLETFFSIFFTLIYSSIFIQDSKRSSQDFVGRTDGNIKVIFPKKPELIPGDYCSVEINSSTTETLKGSILSPTTLVNYYKKRNKL